MQGEREFVKDCRSLGRFELQNIPPLPAGVVKIAITFNLDEENLLTVTAKEQNIGIRQNIVIKPSCGLTDDQVEQILIDAIHNSKNDYEDRILQETILESKKLIHQIQNAINQAPELITPNKKEKILKYMYRLQHTFNEKKINQIIKEKGRLEKYTKSFIKSFVNLSINNLLKGCTIHI